MGAVGVEVKWTHHNSNCKLTNISSKRSLMGYYIYSKFRNSGRLLLLLGSIRPTVLAMVLDFTILIFTILGLRRHELSPNSALWSVVTQGVGYVIVTTLVLVPVTVRVSSNPTECSVPRS